VFIFEYTEKWFVLSCFTRQLFLPYTCVEIPLIDYDQCHSIGDGTTPVEIVAGDKLSDLSKLQEIGKKYGLKTSIVDSKEKLAEKLFSLEEGGLTALGPGLAVSVAMASARQGSEVILCTVSLDVVLKFSEPKNDCQMRLTSARARSVLVKLFNHSLENFLLEQKQR
jgi:hypothetical protein